MRIPKQMMFSSVALDRYGRTNIDREQKNVVPGLTMIWKERTIVSELKQTFKSKLELTMRSAAL